MKIIETKLKGCFILEPKVYKDNRGYFFESFNSQEFYNLTGERVNFVQDNEAKSLKGVLRGLHFQKGEFAQAKLVRVLKGKVQDVVVDMRSDSITYGNYMSILLSSDNKKQVFIPKGFAHGYLTLKKDTIFAYKCDNYYAPNFEDGIMYNDESLNIDWLLKEKEMIISEKDKIYKSLR